MASDSTTMSMEPPTTSSITESVTSSNTEPGSNSRSTESESTTMSAEPPTTSSITETVTISSITEPVTTTKTAESESTKSSAEPLSTKRTTEPEGSTRNTEPPTTNSFTETITTKTMEHESTTSSTDLWTASSIPETITTSNKEPPTTISFTEIIKSSTLETVPTTRTSMTISTTPETITRSSTEPETMPITTETVESSSVEPVYSSSSTKPPTTRITTETAITSSSESVTSINSTDPVTSSVTTGSVTMTSTIEPSSTINSREHMTMSSTTESVTSRSTVPVTTSSNPEQSTTRRMISTVEISRMEPVTTSSSSERPTTTAVSGICKGRTGFVPNPNDCSTFYDCTDGIPKLSACTMDKHFNPVIKICQDPCEAKCDLNADCSTKSDKVTITENPSRSTPTSNSTEMERTTPTLFTTVPTESIVTSNFTSISFRTTNTQLPSTDIEESTTQYFKTTQDLKPDDQTTEPTTTVTRNLTSLETTTSFLFTDSTTEQYSTTGVFVTSTTEVSTDDVTRSSSTSPLTSKTTVPTSTQTEAFDTTPEETRESTEITTVSDNTSTIGPILTTCTHEDCLSSKVPNISTPIPYSLCKRKDFLANPKCNEYRDCTEGIPIDKQCPRGLYFNPTSRVCDWPHTAGCGEIVKPLLVPDDSFKCPCKSCIIPSTVNCSDYYLCLGFAAYHMTCTNNLFFDRDLNTCNYAIMVKCYHSTITAVSSTTAYTKKYSTTITTSTIRPQVSSTTTSVSSTARTTTSARPPISSTTSKPKQFNCPRRNGLFKHPTNCGKFIQCSNWMPYEMLCPATTHFSEITERCEYPCDAKCDSSLSCRPTQNAHPKDRRCPCRNCKLPSPVSCDEYINCHNGQPRTVKCGWGKLFDERKSSCDWANKVPCKHSKLCPERNGLFPHKDDCHKFIMCSNGIPRERMCKYNLEFDPDLKRCEWPNRRCNVSSIAKEFDIFKSKEYRDGWICPKTFGYFPDHQHCNKFYLCSSGTPSLRECSDGLLYNIKHQTCDWKDHVKCDRRDNRNARPKRCRRYNNSISCPKDRKPLPHSYCNMYFDCITGRACAKKCPVGLHFNKTTGICDLPANVLCA